MSVRTKIGLWLSRGVAAIFAVLEARGCYIHFTTEDWPDHAQFHSLTGFFYYLCLTIFFFLITGEPFRLRKKYAWWSIILMGTLVHGSQVVVDFFTHGLRGGGTSQGSGTLFFGLAIAAFVVYQIAAFLCYKHFAPVQESQMNGNDR